jgi:protein ImuB
MATPVRTMVVWCLDWPVVAQGIPSVDAAAVFVANRVVASSEGARAAGVSRGMRRREAQGRCPDLVVLERDEARETRAFEQIARTVEVFAPRLEIVRPGTCALATRGPSRYFGGDHALAAKVQARVSEVLAGRTECRVGVADGPFAADLVARRSVGDATGSRIVAVGQSPAFLAPLPISVLERPDLVDVLGRLGLRTLGAFAALDTASVVGRFGTEGLLAHRLAAGLDERPPDARDPQPDLRFAAVLDPPAERVEQVAFIARELAEELHAALDARGLACTRVAIEAKTEHGEQLSRLWRHEGALSPGAIADRVRWQIDGWLHASVATRPTGGIVHLGLVPDDVIAAKGRQLGFWGEETEADTRAARALARLASMLGHDAVLVPERAGGRGPGDAVRLVPAAGVDLRERELTPISAARDAPWPGRVPAPAPSVVHDPRPVVQLRDAAGADVVVSGRGLLSAPPVDLVIEGMGREAIEIVGWAGPWMVDERWWDPTEHRRAARLQVQGATGVAWLVVREGGHWWLEATYD